MQNAPTHEVFVEALIALRDCYHIKDHTFFDQWVEGGLQKEQMGRYMAQHYHLAQEILRPFGVGGLRQGTTGRAGIHY